MISPQRLGKCLHFGEWEGISSFFKFQNVCNWMFLGVSKGFNWVYFESFKTGTIGCFIAHKRADVIVFVSRGPGNIHLIIRLYNHQNIVQHDALMCAEQRRTLRWHGLQQHPMKYHPEQT